MYCHLQFCRCRIWGSLPLEWLKTGMFKNGAACVENTNPDVLHYFLTRTLHITILMTFCQGGYVPITILIRAELRSLHTANLQILLTSTKIWVLRSINRPSVTMADHFAFSHPNAHSLKRFIDSVHVLWLENLTNKYWINVWHSEAWNLLK